MDTDKVVVKFKIVGELPINRVEFSNEAVVEYIQDFSNTLNEKIKDIVDWYQLGKVKTFVVVPEIPPLKKIAAYTIETKIDTEV